MKTQKLAVIGAGHVGSHVLAYAAKSELFGEIAVIDPRGNIAYGEALDQDHATGLLSRRNIHIHSGGYEEVADADIVIVSATHVYAPEPVPADRQELMKNNASIIREIMDNVVKHTRDAILIFITNPADTVAYIAANEYDYPSQQILSTGCMLDSARLRHFIGRHYGVDPKSVAGYMMGEHGYTAFPVLSRLTVGGIAFDDLAEYFPDVEPLTADQIKEHVVQTAYEVFDAKVGVTNAGVAESSIELARAILLDEKAIYPVAVSFTNGEYGFDQPSAFSVPCVLGRRGVERRLMVSLNDWETEKLKISVASIQASIALAESLK
ncbi:lactate/malate family dehydrogenase [Fundicoccus sp. Sow4_D5]|uniref:lactate/malate family dehydrogenase n=1 Tax=unclassified Fundicoccus TaxID=2761543 RepID=UPI003F90D9E0